MSLYIVGFLIFLLCLIVLLYNRQWFFYLTVFFTPFSSTALVDLGYNIVLLPFSLLVLNLLCYLLYIFVKFGIPYNNHYKWLNGNLLTIASVLLASAFMPFFINGELMVLDKFSDLLTYASPIPLKPSMQYVTQLIYTLLGLWFVYFVAKQIQTTKVWLTVLNVLIVSCTFIALWGLFEFSTYYLGIEYPALLFSNVGLNSEGINMLNNMPRISSVTLEPSAFAQTFSFIIPIMFWGIKYGQVFFSKFGDRLIIFLFLIAFVLCNSSTAYILLFFWLLLFFWDVIIRKKRHSIKIVVIALATGTLIVLVPFAIGYIENKLLDYSGLERTLAVVSGLRYFLEYPVFGIGWGVFHVWDFVINVLCGAGIIGLIVFLMFFNRIRIEFSKLESTDYKLKMPVIYGAISFLMAIQVSGFLYYTQYVWLYLALIVSFIVVSKISKNEPG